MVEISEKNERFHPPNPWMRYIGIEKLFLHWVYRSGFSALVPPLGELVILVSSFSSFGITFGSAL